ncbi:energy transducer TonB [Pyxidicoccus fallax]|uniref:Energy transducer TonB n=1 Tax=Pyxidicoccus fallax TaxID=394095 RepID=A0A848LB21_9BACT|nr:energy transducer TonB [Pyxidicoccus fallax]NMO16260.1 energy transducer TonB [Pyxidicoccus fallax]NPC78669.1 energy transducer TonB [Pyxidicoccus fallax]
MFKSVIEPKRAGRLGAGMWVSFGVHAALFVGVLFISARPSEPPPEPDKEYILKLAQGPNLAKGTPAPAGPKPTTPPKPRPPKRDRIPTQVQPLPADPTPVEPDPAPTSSGDTEETAHTGGEGIVGGHPDGDPNSTAIGVPLIPGLTGGGEGGTGTEVLPFGSGMTPPVLVGGQNIDYTPEARVARVEGTLIAKCVIAVDGTVRDCRIIKGLAHMDAAVVDALHSRRYRPVTFQGRPVSVSYVFTIRLKLPR